MTGRIVDGSRGLTGKPRLTLEINEDEAFEMAFDELHEKDKITIELKPYREKRSRDANAYCFALIDKIAEKLNIDKKDVYREAIRNIGGVSEIVCVRNIAVDSLISAWSARGLGWQAETFPSKLAGCTNVILYYGSSTYNTMQMSRLIDAIVTECKDLGIETMPPTELKSLLERWDK